jgi:hypothetical protein
MQWSEESSNLYWHTREETRRILIEIIEKWLEENKNEINTNA